MAQEPADVTVENHGSIYLFRASNPAVLEWFATHTDAFIWGSAYVVEPRYVQSITEALQEEGFTVG